MTDVFNLVYNAAQRDRSQANRAENLSPGDILPYHTAVLLSPENAGTSPQAVSLPVFTAPREFGQVKAAPAGGSKKTSGHHKSYYHRGQKLQLFFSGNFKRAAKRFRNV